MGRLFGVRDVGLGILVFYGLENPPLLGPITLFNAATDCADLVAIGMAYREGIPRAALASAGFALPAAIAWLVVYSQLG